MHLAQPPNGEPKLQIKEVSSRYMFSWLHVWLEKHLTRGDYHREQVIPRWGACSRHR